MEIADVRHANASAFPGRRLAGNGRNTGDITGTCPTAHRADGGANTGNGYFGTGSTYFGANNRTAIADPRRYEAGETGLRG